MFNPLHGSTNQELFKKPHYENTNDFHDTKEVITCYHQISIFTDSKNGWNITQRRTLGNPWRMHCTHCSMLKGTCQAKVMSNSEKIEPIALAVIKLRLFEGISHSVEFSTKYFFYFCSNFLKAFQVNLKA